MTFSSPILLSGSKLMFERLNSITYKHGLDRDLTLFGLGFSNLQKTSMHDVFPHVL
jgi:hypothetical protein